MEILLIKKLSIKTVSNCIYVEKKLLDQKLRRGMGEGENGRILLF
jgi:hypothetical protein